MRAESPHTCTYAHYYMFTVGALFSVPRKTGVQRIFTVYTHVRALLLAESMYGRSLVSQPATRTPQ